LTSLSASSPPQISSPSRFGRAPSSSGLSSGKNYTIVRSNFPLPPAPEISPVFPLSNLNRSKTASCEILASLARQMHISQALMLHFRPNLGAADLESE
jgi:hypothetical protein